MNFGIRKFYLFKNIPCPNQFPWPRPSAFSSEMHPSYLVLILIYPPASEASREVEYFDWRKKHTPTRILCQNFVTLSVCHGIRPKLSQDWQNRMGWNFFYKSLSKSHVSNFFFLPQAAGRAGAEAQKTTQTRNIRRGVWNLPHKFHLYLIVIIFYSQLKKEKIIQKLR